MFRYICVPVCAVISSCPWKSSQRYDTIQRFSLWSSRLAWLRNLRYFIFSCFYEGKKVYGAAVT